MGERHEETFYQRGYADGKKALDIHGKCKLMSQGDTYRSTGMAKIKNSDNTKYW